MLIPNDKLTTEMIPAADAPWDDIQSFALTFDGYTYFGSVAKLAAAVREERHETLSEVRACLFFEQRRLRHIGEPPDEDDLLTIRRLLALIRKKLNEQMWMGMT